MASEMWKEEWQAVCVHARACSNYWLDYAWQIWSLQNGWPRLPPPRPPSTPPPLRQHLPLPHLQQPPMPRAAWTTEPRPRSAHAVRTRAHTHTHTLFHALTQGLLIVTVWRVLSQNSRTITRQHIYTHTHTNHRVSHRHALSPSPSLDCVVGGRLETDVIRDVSSCLMKHLFFFLSLSDTW